MITPARSAQIPGMMPQFRSGTKSSTPPANWWEAGGATGAVVAYQPKGAASYAASLVNLANPGVNDATDNGVLVPGWSSANGWEFNSSSFILTGVSSGIFSVFLQATAVTNPGGGLFGSQMGGGTFYRIYGDSGGQAYYANGTTSQQPASPGFSGGNIGMAGTKAYLNGSDVGITMNAPDGVSTNAFYIGAENFSGTPNEPTAYNCTAFAIWDNNLTAPQIAAVVAAMAAL